MQIKAQMNDFMYIRQNHFHKLFDDQKDKNTNVKIQRKDKSELTEHALEAFNRDQNDNDKITEEEKRIGKIQEFLRINEKSTQQLPKEEIGKISINRFNKRTINQGKLTL